MSHTETTRTEALTSVPGDAVYEIVIADDDAKVRDALTGLLGDYPGFFLAGAATTGTEAAQVCATLKPHVALIDVMMPAGGCEAATAILSGSPETVVVAYTAKADSRTNEALTGCGVSRVFVKGAGDDLAASLFELIDRHVRCDGGG